MPQQYDFAGIAFESKAALREIARLQTALEEILALSVPAGSDFGNAEIAWIARKALAGKVIYDTRSL